MTELRHHKPILMIYNNTEKLNKTLNVSIIIHNLIKYLYKVKQAIILFVTSDLNIYIMKLINFVIAL